MGFWGSAVENLVNENFWRGKRVLITGHTGFKGSWLSLWLSQYSTVIKGLSLPISDKNYLYNRINLNHLKVDETFSDIRDYSQVRRVISEFNPEIIFHMAAQPIVTHSYTDPVETFTTNILGTINILEAVRAENTKTTIVNITTDKCYENKEWIWPYREIDSLGGQDPYSASKACSEIITHSYRSSFSEKNSLFAIASARAGNVIGGGDMSEDRLVPDFLKALKSNKSITLRNPNSIRPWQFILDPISGYLQLAQALYSNPMEFSSAWNFGPSEEAKSVGYVIQRLIDLSEAKSYKLLKKTSQPHEEKSLMLDSARARTLLNWRSKLDLRSCLEWTMDWHHASTEQTDMTEFSVSQIQRYCEIG